MRQRSNMLEPGREVSFIELRRDAESLLPHKTRSNHEERSCDHAQVVHETRIAHVHAVDCKLHRQEAMNIPLESGPVREELLAMGVVVQRSRASQAR